MSLKRGEQSARDQHRQTSETECHGQLWGGAQPRITVEKTGAENNRHGRKDPQQEAEDVRVNFLREQGNPVIEWEDRQQESKSQPEQGRRLRGERQVTRASFYATEQP